ADRLYVIDRGYADYQLFRDILDAGSSFVARVKDNTAFTVSQERPIPEAARAAGVVRDAVLARLGTDRHKDVVGRPVRLVIVRRTRSDGTPEELWLVTDRSAWPPNWWPWLTAIVGRSSCSSAGSNGSWVVGTCCCKTPTA